MWTAELKGTRVKYDGFKTSILEQSKKFWIKDPNTSILCNLNLGSRLESDMNVGFVLSGYTETRIKMFLSSNYKQKHQDTGTVRARRQHDVQLAGVHAK